MAFSRPTLSEIITRIKSDIVSRISGATTLLRRSILTVMAYAYGAAVHLLYGNIEYNKDQLFISTADTDSLEVHANEYGISRVAAAKATGTAVATGTDGITIPQYSELQSALGQVYLTDAAVTITGGVATLALTAKAAGEDGNDDPSISLTFVSPIAGVDTAVTVSAAGLDNGSDEEDDDSLRARVLARKRLPPHGGIKEDYEEWMREYPGVTRSWAIPKYQGIGTVGCAFVRDDDSDLIPSDTEIAAVKAYIVSHADPITGKTVGVPITAEEGLYMIKLERMTVNFIIKIYPNNSETQIAVTSQLNDLIKVDGGPEQALRLSRITAAISASVGEEHNQLVYPAADVTASAAQVHTMGTITFQDY